MPAYKLARKKQVVELQPVEVEVKEFAILGLEGDLVEFRSRVSSGTYLRSLAHELGQKLATARIWPACDERLWPNLPSNRASRWSRWPSR